MTAESSAGPLSAGKFRAIRHGMTFPVGNAGQAQAGLGAVRRSAGIEYRQPGLEQDLGGGVQQGFDRAVGGEL